MANPSIQLGTNSNWAIKEDKLLAYKEYNDYFFNKEFDFSRGTSATYVAKDGLIKTAGIQPNIVNNGDFSELGSELITNGDFSDGSSNWVAEGGSSTWVIDNVANKISSSNFALYQNITRTVGKIYKISFDIVEYTSGSLSVSLGNGASTSFNTAGSKTIYKEWDGPDNRVIFRSSFIGKIDNISVKKVDPNNYWTLGGEAIIDNGLVSFVSASNTYSYIRQDVSSLAASLYKISIEVKNYVSGAVQVGFQGSSPNLQNLNVSADGVYTVELSPNANGDDLEISREFAGGAFDFDVDNVTVQEIQTDTPRIDFTNDTKGHLLLEPQSTNLLQRSNEFDNSYWGKQNVTVTANSAISPDGTNNAFLLDVGTADDDHSLRKPGIAPTSTYTVSIFAKKGSTDYAWFLCGGSSRGVQAIFDLSDGSVTDSGTVGTAQTLIAAKSVDMGNGWYRLIMEAETTAPPSNNLTITPYYQDTFSGNITTSWQGNNETIYIYGAMNEESSFATSYIPTTNAASTRNADVCNNSGSAQDFNSEEGVLYAEIAALADDGTNRRISISNDSTQNRVVLMYHSTSNVVRGFVSSGGSLVSDMTYTVSDTTQFNKIAFYYKQDDFKLWIDGVQRATDDSGAAPIGLNTLRFEDGNGSFDFYGKVRNVQVFTEALTDAELQELTS